MGAVMKTFVDSFLLSSRKDVIYVVDNLVQSLKQRIHSSGDFVEMNIQPIMKMLTFDVFSRSAFSTDLDCCKTLSGSPISRAFEFLSRDMTERLEKPLHPLHLFYWLPTERNRKHKKAVELIQNFLDSLLQKAKLRLASSSDQDRNADLLTRLLEAHKKALAEQQDEAIADEMVLDGALKDVMKTLVVAGYDTTSTTLMYSLYLLSMNPNMQDLCVEEVKSLEYGDLSDPEKLVLCSAVCQEALRLYPPGFQTSRTLLKPVTLSGEYVVPEGTHITVPFWVIQRGKNTFVAPESFRPDRWAKKINGRSGKWITRDYESEKAKPDESATIPAGNPDAVLSFSAGARSCPGAKFARQEAVIALANLLKEIKFTPIPGYQLKLKVQGILPSPEGGLPLRIEERTGY
jgi:cytochrome P450